MFSQLVGSKDKKTSTQELFFRDDLGKANPPDLA